MGETNVYSLEAYIEDNVNLGFAKNRSFRSVVSNVLMIGRSQTGKSTIAQTIEKPRQSVSGKGFSVTKEAQCNTLIVHD